MGASLPFVMMGTSTAASVAAGGAQKQAAKAGQYFAPIIAEHNASIYEADADLATFNASLDKSTTARRLHIMDRLGDLEMGQMLIQRNYVRKAGKIEHDHLQDQADATRKFGKEDRVRMEEDGNRLRRSVEARQGASGLVQGTGSLGLVSAEFQSRLELAEQDHRVKTEDQANRFEYRADVALHQSKMQSAMIGFNIERTKFNIRSQIHTEQVAGTVRQIEHQNQIRKLRTKAVLTRMGGDLQAHAYGQQAKAATFGQVGSAAKGGYNAYDYAFDMGYVGNRKPVKVGG